MQDCYIDYNEKFTKRKGGKQKMPNACSTMPACRETRRRCILLLQQIIILMQ